MHARKHAVVMGRRRMIDCQRQRRIRVRRGQAPDDRIVQREPNQDLLGHKGKAGEFEWMTWQQTMTTAENFSMGMKQLDLVKKLERDGRTWQFFGIQSKNNKEWVLANMAGMFQGMTSVGLFDTLGENAIKYICN